MKTSVLFVLTGLGLGGAQKSFVNLVNTIDSDKYAIDVLLFDEKQKQLTKDIRTEYKSVSINGRGKYFFSSIKQSVKDLLHQKSTRLAIYRLLNPILIKANAQKKYQEQVIWELIGGDLENVEKEYDYAIAYCQGLPTFFVADRVNARYKIAWMHSDPRLQTHDYAFETSYYKKYDRVNCVSEKAKASFIELYDTDGYSVEVFNNLCDVNNILERSKETVQDIDDCHKFKLCTVGRLCEAKGYYIAIDVAKELQRRGMDFIWYIVGEGELHKQLQKRINDCNLEKNFILLGARENPYPYMEACDIYVQTSIYEGYCITLTEARILKKTIVTTNFSGASEQIENDFNGFICECEWETLADRIAYLMDNRNVRDKFIRNSSFEVKNEQTSSFDIMINSLKTNN